MRKYIYILGEKYNKTAFSKKWSELTANNVGKRFGHPEHDFIKQAISINPIWQKIMDRGPNFYFKVIKKKFQAKSVRGIALISPNSSREIWIGKQKLIEMLFPPKKPQALVDDSPTEHRKAVLKALRQIIEPQIKQYRLAVRRQIKGTGRYKLRCAITGESLDHGEFHIDHKIPFKLIVEDWCREICKDLEQIEVVCRGTSCKLADIKLAENFFDYHLLHSQLQVVTVTANLSKGSKIL